jgi:hypothetical protein
MHDRIRHKQTPLRASGMLRDIVIAGSERMFASQD